LNSRKAAIGKVAFSGRENILAVVPAPHDDRGLMAYTLRFPNELRNQTDYFRDIKTVPVNADSLELAETLIKKMSAKLDLTKFEDGYEVAVKALVEAKINNLPVPIDEAPKQQPTNVVNLMDALRKSIGPDTRGGKKPPKSEKEPPAKKIALVKSKARRKSA
jgi:DNA end-binding protein Ku